MHEQKNYRTLEHALTKYELNTTQGQLDLYIENWKEIKQRNINKRCNNKSSLSLFD